MLAPCWHLQVALNKYEALLRGTSAISKAKLSTGTLNNHLLPDFVETFPFVFCIYKLSHCVKPFSFMEDLVGFLLYLEVVGKGKLSQEMRYLWVL